MPLNGNGWIPVSASTRIAFCPLTVVFGPSEPTWERLVSTDNPGFSVTVDRPVTITSSQITSV